MNLKPLGSKKRTMWSATPNTIQEETVCASHRISTVLPHHITVEFCQRRLNFVSLTEILWNSIESTFINYCERSLKVFSIFTEGGGRVFHPTGPNLALNLFLLMAQGPVLLYPVFSVLLCLNTHCKVFEFCGTFYNRLRLWQCWLTVSTATWL